MQIGPISEDDLAVLPAKGPSMRPHRPRMLAAQESLAKLVVIVICARGPLSQILGPFDAIRIAVLQQLLWLAQAGVGRSVDVGCHQQLYPMWVDKLHCVAISIVRYLQVDMMPQTGKGSVPII